MNIAIDLSPLQGPHRMRGIGYTVIHFVNNISISDRKKNRYIFYILPASDQQYDPFDLIDLDGFEYEVRELKKGWKLGFKLPGKLQHLIRLIDQGLSLLEARAGDSRVGNLNGVDVFLQCDQSQTLPRKRRRVRSVIILYDIIPYVLEWDYLWSYKTAKERGYSWKGASLSVLRRCLYKKNLKINLKRASLLLAISESTAKDFKKVFRIKDEKIQVVPLGVPDRLPNLVNKPILKKYSKTSWGYFTELALASDFEKPFLLFVGGADRRRKLEDLVGAFNMLRAQGEDILLVMVGDSMQGPDTISTAESQKAIMSSSYLDDVVFMGFVEDDVREWLYDNALAFVFPSKYEGFGLPVLEAMQYGTPVISYKNEATVEVAGNLPIYAESYLDIFESAKDLLENGFSESKGKAYISHASRYSWAKTSQNIIKHLSK